MNASVLDRAAPFSDKQGKEAKLLLFMFAGCPYCNKVVQTAGELGHRLPTVDIRQDAEALAILLKVGGKKTVPCLFINGEAMYESQAIAHYLRDGLSAAK